MSMLGRKFILKDVLNTSKNISFHRWDDNTGYVECFTSNNLICAAFTTDKYAGSLTYRYLDSGSSQELRVYRKQNYSASDWEDSNYKTIVFTHEPTKYQIDYMDATEAQIEAWLLANGEEVFPIKYITNEDELTSIANAIRAKGGTSESLLFPSGFVSAIMNL